MKAVGGCVGWSWYHVGICWYLQMGMVMGKHFLKKRTTYRRVLHCFSALFLSKFFLRLAHVNLKLQKKCSCFSFQCYRLFKIIFQYSIQGPATDILTSGFLQIHKLLGIKEWIRFTRWRYCDWFVLNQNCSNLYWLCFFRFFEVYMNIQRKTVPTSSFNGTHTIFQHSML